ncbi:MAG TPA: HNH endonuclease signature motif containing protein [Vicinamibacteria bacterium]|nr:HNH endonuclease signature motif containing protein [Vicinamibacteria bacterium]
MKITHASHLDNTELTAELGRLAGFEREATAALIVHLAEFDARRLFEGAGYSSLFKYGVEVLHLSEDAVYNRIKAARAAREYPVIIDLLESGALSPTTVRLLAPRLTRENHEELLAAAAGKGKQAVEELLARRFPQPDVPARVRKVPTRLVTPVADVAPTGGAPTAGPAVAGGEPLAAAHAAASAAEPPLVLQVAAVPRAVVRPLAPERYEIRFTASAEMREKLRVAQDLLGHAIPTGDLAQVFDRALTLLVADLSRRKFAATGRPRRSRGQSDESRNIPADVKRRAVARDEHRCAFVAPDGRRCDERRFLEFHHVVPYAAGGQPTVENIQLRCRAHNGYETDLFYGPGTRRTRDGVVRSGRAIHGGRVTVPRTGSGTSTHGDATPAPPGDPIARA